jgi:valyl-tRNA synthetase
MTRQLRRLGASLDWPRERFTMDEGLSRAVIEVFVRLHRDGLIYRDNPAGELGPGVPVGDQRPRGRKPRGEGTLWTLRYPLEDGSGFIEVATTRPETMLADVAVAVHPEDGRFAGLVGQARHPAAGGAAASRSWRMHIPIRRRERGR